MKLDLFSKENGLTTGLGMIALTIVSLFMWGPVSSAEVARGVLVIGVGIALIVWHFWKP
jgi:uncharacterized membrane protein